MIKKENTRINVTISKKLREKLEDKAEYEDRSISSMAAYIIKKYFENEDESSK